MERRAFVRGKRKRTHFKPGVRPRQFIRREAAVRVLEGEDAVDAVEEPLVRQGGPHQVRRQGSNREGSLQVDQCRAREIRVGRKEVGLLGLDPASLSAA